MVQKQYIGIGHSPETMFKPGYVLESIFSEKVIAQRPFTEIGLLVGLGHRLDLSPARLRRDNFQLN